MGWKPRKPNYGATPRELRALLEKTADLISVDSYGAEGLNESKYPPKIVDRLEAALHEVAHWAVLTKELRDKHEESLQGGSKLSNTVNNVLRRMPLSIQREYETRTIAVAVRLGRVLDLFDDEAVYIHSNASINGIDAMHVDHYIILLSCRLDAERAVRLMQEWTKPPKWVQ